ncbi:MULTISPECIES: hypothetical protein [Methylocaldum]|jgi:hypothetical protein|uniref:hypothetical protein n=1 Tax=unclassified Methylocaldum TaxID=2622260 RepID=UPI00098AC9E0|nr:MULTISPECIES: hypothetical protein [unclassified Methylocaldum]MBP1153087.1 hypothetical protein [Methylocaldum sp. RMAD-M]MDV3242650.1 hypothetical protein [Methylocaldum sp.]
MPANMRQDERIEVFSFIALYEGLSGLLIDLDLYVFNKAGELIECQPIWKGKTVVALSGRELSNARVMIGPPIRDSIRGPITMDMIRNYHGFEVGFDLVPKTRSVTLSAVPEAIWRTWQQSGSWSKSRKHPNAFDGFLFW